MKIETEKKIIAPKGMMINQKDWDKGTISFIPIIIKKHFKDIKTYEDAIDEMPTDEENIIYPTDSVDVVVYKKLKHIIKVVNGPDFIVDWTNNNQKKWYPYFKVVPSGFGFSGSCYDCTCTFTDVSSRLCLESDEKATHVGTQFTNLYELFILK